MLTVIIASRNGAATLPRVLEAYCGLAQPAQGWRMLVVDNGSTDSTRAILDSYAGRLPLRCLHEPRPGKNVALNRALAAALELAEPQGGLFVFSDDDATPASDWLLRLAETAQAQPGYAVFGGSIVADWAEPPPDWVLRLAPLGMTFGITSPSLPEGPVFPGLVWGANMAVRRAVFEAGYRFDEQVGPNGGAYAMGSETQLTRRLSSAGYLPWFCPAARVAHHIRTHQTEAGHILQRAWSFGRGKCRQDIQAGRGPYPYLLRVPRWMWKRLLLESGGLALALLRGDADQQFLRRWESAYLRGYIREAWRGPPVGGRRVLITGYSGALGGMELRMAQEARFLNAAGCDTTLALHRFPGSAAWSRALRAERIAASELTMPLFFEEWRWRRLNRWRAMLWTRRALQRHRADLVHVAFCWTGYGASALWLAQRCGLPAVVSVHNAFPPVEYGPWHRRLLAQAFSAVKGIYAVSESALQHFMALYHPYIQPGTRLAVIPNGVDTRRFRPSPGLRAEARRGWAIPPGSLVMGSVARLAEQKRPQAALALLAALRVEFPHLYLVLVGDGPLETALRRQAQELGVADYVVFTGFQVEVERLLPGMDVHVLLSRNEGFGIATIEAMACGVPAVGTDVPGTADVLRGCAGGVLAPLDEPEALRHAVAALLRDPARRACMGQSGRHEAERLYSQEQVGEMVQAFYRGLV
ncbi:glycosyltransferase [Pseudoduganella aquatica]|uniref:glycosyltransferase n=1 Tax=Pseudoduganella aquatica TaxID=2660641 RepID=UPI001E5297A1|nr:glycosyltransferase [Pseudoduganella aquatica]